jgi:hypothetical protein
MSRFVGPCMCGALDCEACRGPLKSLGDYMGAQESCPNCGLDHYEIGDEFCVVGGDIEECWCPECEHEWTQQCFGHVSLEVHHGVR